MANICAITYIETISMSVRRIPVQRQIISAAGVKVENKSFIIAKSMGVIRPWFAYVVVGKWWKGK